MNRQISLRVDGAKLVHRLAENVHNAAERRAADRNFDVATRVDSLHAANHALDRFHGNGAHPAFTEVLLHFDGDVERLRHVEAFAGHANRIVDCGQVTLFKLNIKDGANDLNDSADIFFFVRHFLVLSLRAVRGAAHNFNDFLGDCSLANLVHVQRQGLDDFSGVAGGGFHGGHARGIFCRR